MWVKLAQKHGSISTIVNGTMRRIRGGETIDISDEDGERLLAAGYGFIASVDPSIVEFVADVTTDDMPVDAAKADIPTNHEFVSNRNSKACVRDMADGTKCEAPPEIHMGYVAPAAAPTPETETKSAVSVADLTSGGRRTGAAKRRKAK